MTRSGPPVYLDHNATTPVLPEVVEAMLPYLREHFGNPSSDHVFGSRAFEAVEAARVRVASLIGAAPEEIVFTSGGTEACNLAILGVAEMFRHKKQIVASAIEHPATAEPCRLLRRGGWQIEWLGVDENGRVRPGDAARAATGQTALVTVMHANSETGTIQPIKDVARSAHSAGALCHTDAAQSVGKVPVDVNVLGVDLLSIAGHKLYAPKGVGALYIRRGTPLEPVLRGAGHEGGLRPGTENVASIVGFGRACEIARTTIQQELERVQELRDLLWDLLRDCIPGVAVNGHLHERLPNTLNVRFPSSRGSAVLAFATDVAASTGTACHEGGGTPSAVLQAMGLPPEAALGSVRLSLGRGTTEAAVRRSAQALVGGWRQAAGARG